MTRGRNILTLLLLLALAAGALSQLPWAPVGQDDAGAQAGNDAGAQPNGTAPIHTFGPVFARNGENGTEEGNVTADGNGTGDGNGTISGPGDETDNLAGYITIDAEATVTDIGEKITFTAVDSSNGSISPSYDWYVPRKPGTADTGAKVFSTAREISVGFDRVGKYTVVLQVSEGDESWDVKQSIHVITQDDFDPVADAGGDQVLNTSLSAGLDGRGSFDPDGDPLNYTWSMPGSNDRYGDRVTWRFDGAGRYTITLTVTDEDGQDTDQMVVKVNQEAGDTEAGELPVIGGDDKGGDDGRGLLLGIMVLVVLVIVILLLVWMFTGRKEREYRRALTREAARDRETEPDVGAPSSPAMAVPMVTTPALASVRPGGVADFPSRATGRTSAGPSPPARASRKEPASTALKGRPKPPLTGGKPSSGAPASPKQRYLSRQLEMETKKIEDEMESELKDLGISFD